jgi:RHS repeat-associated protein
VVEANGDRVTWSHDGIYQLVREQRSAANGYDVSYSYDALGNRLTAVESGVTTTYSYDEANQLSYDYTPTLRTTYSYDANGNTTLINAGGGVTTYCWDVENRMTRAELPTGGRTTATYDGDGKRRSYADSAGFRGFLWDGENIARETDGAGATVAAYSYAPSVYGALLSQRRGGATSFHHGACPERSRGDVLGSTRQLTDASQSPTDSYLYRAFGEPTVLSGSSPNPFTWVGRLGYYWQPDTSDYWVRARVYQQSLGCFVGRDPVATEINRYCYPGSSPVRLADPSGMEAKRCGTCGVDITTALHKTLIYIEQLFEAMPWDQKLVLCRNTISIDNIDLMELRGGYPNPPGCGEPQETCGGTVLVNGHCHDSRTVNYAQVGLAVALCNRLTRDFADVLDFASGPQRPGTLLNPFGPTAARTVIGGYSPVAGAIATISTRKGLAGMVKGLPRAMREGAAYRRGALLWYDVGYAWGTNVGLRDFLIPDSTSAVALALRGPSFPSGSTPKDKQCPHRCPRQCEERRFTVRWGGEDYPGREW